MAEKTATHTDGVGGHYLLIKLKTEFTGTTDCDALKISFVITHKMLALIQYKKNQQIS